MLPDKWQHPQGKCRSNPGSASSNTEKVARHEYLVQDPLLVGLGGAARTCGVSSSMFKKLDRTAQVPAPVRLGRRVLWVRAELTEWTNARCPPRHRWEAMRRAARGGEK